MSVKHFFVVASLLPHRLKGFGYVRQCRPLLGASVHAPQWLSAVPKIWAVAHATLPSHARDFSRFASYLERTAALFSRYLLVAVFLSLNTGSTDISFSFCHTASQPFEVKMSYADAAAKGPKQSPEEVSLQSSLRPYRGMTS